MFLNGAANPKTCCDNGLTCFGCLGYRCASSSKILHCCLIILQIKINDRLHSISDTKSVYQKGLFTFLGASIVSIVDQMNPSTTESLSKMHSMQICHFLWKILKKTAAKEQLMCVCIKNKATLTHSSVPCGETKLPTLAHTQWLQCITMLYYRWG